LLHETAIPIDSRIKRACDIWGLDPLYVASEGRFIAIIDGQEAERAVEILSQTEPALDIQVIGEVMEGSGQVVMKTAVGGKRPIQPLPSELLPRIC
jgi:hydrogenase expression/formation protein HypE